MAEYTDHLYCDTYPYVTAEELLTCCSGATGMEDDDPRVLDAIEDASLVMYYLTGKQFAGTCTATVRPGCLSGACFCGCTPNQVNLGLWPVTQLNSVTYQGVTYEDAELAATFHINDYRYLARNDGEHFLSGNQWAITGSSEDSVDNGYVFEANVDYGIKVPRLLTRATRELACQFMAACCGGDCDLPDNVTSVSRAGVTFDVATASEALRNGKTGVFTVDLAISTFNPSKLQSPSFLWNPNIEHGRRINT